MFGLDSNIQEISLSGVEKFDVIEYNNENLQTSKFIVFDSSIDEKIPALLLQLWKFEGGYDHAFANVMEIDFGINKRVKHYIPKKQNVTVENIISYRPIEKELSEKEQFFFDLWPKSTSQSKTEVHVIPFEIKVDGNIEGNLIIPVWTPLQQIPAQKIKIGSIIEIWNVENVTTIMKVIQL